MKSILIVDDEPDIVTLLLYNLKKEGYSVTAVSDGGDALTAVKKRAFDLVILDLMLPGIHGMEICRILRSNPRTKTLPVIMLTARGEEHDRVQGLESGADDYMTKPFSARELIARVKAVLRRTDGRVMPEQVIRIGDLIINKEACSVARKGRTIHLSATEFRLLLYLAERMGRVFSRDQLLDAVWTDEAFVEPRTVDVHIHRLRMQLEKDPSHPAHIKTRRGLGYYLDRST